MSIKNFSYVLILVVAIFFTIFYSYLHSDVVLDIFKKYTPIQFSQENTQAYKNIDSQEKMLMVWSINKNEADIDIAKKFKTMEQLVDSKLVSSSTRAKRMHILQSI